MSPEPARRPGPLHLLARGVRRHRVAALVVVAAVGAVAWQGVRRVRGVPVDVAVVERRELVQHVVTTGRVRPRSIHLAPLGSGRVATVGCTPGARVAAGTLLVQLDDREAVATLEQARAQEVAAEASAQRLRSFSVAQADEALAQARVHLDQASRDRERIERLVGQDAATRESLEKAITAQRLAASELRDAESDRASLAAGGPQRRSAEASLSQARAAVALAEAQLDHARLVAPVAAVVTACDVEVGDSATAGVTLVELAADAGTELVVEPDERNLALLAVGQPATASAEAFPASTFAAEVSFIAPAVDRRRGTVEVRLKVAKPPAYLRPDMTVSVEIEVARVPDALVVPLGAVRDLAASPWVLVVERGRAVRRSVVLGRRGDDAVEVIDGLGLGDPIIVSQPGLAPGARVQPRPR